MRLWNQCFPAACASLTLFALAAPAHAQVDPSQAVRKIAREVAEEMKEIDRLLMESGRAGQAAPKLEEAAGKMRELIDQTKTSQGKVVRGIDQLIDELQKMAQQDPSQGQQGGQNKPSDQDPQDQQQQQQGGQDQQQQDRAGQENQGQSPRDQGARQEIATPDVAQQPGQQEGQQPQGQQQGQPQGQGEPDQPQQGKVANGGRDTRSPGENRTTGAQSEGASETADHARDAEEWGELQQYVPPQYQRAGVPNVPAKYRRLYEAFQRRSQKAGSGK